MLVTTQAPSGQWANSGWGQPRQRRERIKTTLLGQDDGEIRCPCVIRLGFNLAGGEDPLAVLEQLLAEEGYGSPEDLRGAFPVPRRPYLCRPSTQAAPCALNGRRADVLRQALMLGLCSAQHYDPERPVIWTRGSLSRVVDLFDPAGFYA